MPGSTSEFIDDDTPVYKGVPKVSPDPETAGVRTLGLGQTERKRKVQTSAVDGRRGEVTNQDGESSILPLPSTLTNIEIESIGRSSIMTEIKWSLSLTQTLPFSEHTKTDTLTWNMRCNVLSCS